MIRAITVIVILALAAPLAESSDKKLEEAIAEYQAGVRCRDDIDGKYNFERAYKHFLAAAEANYWPAMRQVMFAHELGLGVDCDQKKAGDWWLKIEGAIATKTITGYDTRPDEDDPLASEAPTRASPAEKKLYAARYEARIKESAKRGYAKSQFVLSQMPGEAAEKQAWLERSAKNGHSAAKIFVGRNCFIQAQEIGPAGGAKYRDLIFRAHQELSEGLDNLLVNERKDLASARTWNIVRYLGKTMGEWKELENQIATIKYQIEDSEMEALLKKEQEAKDTKPR